MTVCDPCKCETPLDERMPDDGIALHERGCPLYTPLRPVDPQQTTWQEHNFRNPAIQPEKAYQPLLGAVEDIVQTTLEQVRKRDFRANPLNGEHK